MGGEDRNETEVKMLARIAALEAEIESLKKSLEQDGEQGGGGMEGRRMEMFDLDEGGGEGYGAFRLEQGDDEQNPQEIFKITQCRFQVGRTAYAIANQSVTGDGLYKLVVTHSNPGNSYVSHDSTTPEQGTGDTTTTIPLFRISGGELTDDYRGMPVIPVYE